MSYYSRNLEFPSWFENTGRSFQLANAWKKGENLNTSRRITEPAHPVHRFKSDREMHDDRTHVSKRSVYVWVSSICNAYTFCCIVYRSASSRLLSIRFVLAQSVIRRSSCYTFCTPSRFISPVSLFVYVLGSRGPTYIHTQCVRVRRGRQSAWASRWLEEKKMKASPLADHSLSCP